MPPRVVIFDMNDVLCRYDVSCRVQVLSDIARRPPQHVRAAIWDSGFEDEADAGRYATSEEYLSAFGERLGHTIGRADWVRALRLSITPLADVLALAAAIAKRARIAIFTNNGPLLKETFGDVFPEAAAIFGKAFYCSCEFAASKPDPTSYRRLMERLGLAPQEAWFIDDKAANVDGARLAGLKAHLFIDHASLAKAARDRGL